MNARLVFSAATAALAGFLFGFDTVVISGAEQRIQSVWHLGAGMHGVAMASALYGTVLGSLVGGWPTDRFGRRKTLLAIGLLYLVSALASALAGNVYELIAARVIGGVGIGVSTVAAPLYIAEIAPARHRGRLAGMFQFNIVLGIVIAYASNSMIAGTGPDAWRWMMGVAALPSLVYAMACFFILESPRWQPARRAADSFWTVKMRLPILIAVLVALFNQLSGINAILYFAPRIFRLAGFGEHAALLQSIGIGVTNLVFTFVGLWLIDRLGRRTLLYIGSVGYIASLGLLTWAFFTGHFAMVPGGLFVFIAAHAVGQGAVMWVLIAEVFPNRHRAAGQTLGSFTHWGTAALITTFFPTWVAHFATGYVFGFFCAMMVLQLIWVKTVVVETKGVSLEQLAARLAT